MTSIILYKQMAISSIKKIFAVSPCIRIEPIETIKTKRHLTEFRQVDIEEAHASMEDSMHLSEKMLRYVIKRIKRKCRTELDLFERELSIPRIPFKRFDYKEVMEILRSIGFDVKYEEEISHEAEEALSKRFKEPFFIMHYPKQARGFYYLEGSDGILEDFDLIYPEGFGEAISGGEREHEFEKVKMRLKFSGEDPLKYKLYLEMLKTGVPPSSGFGLGVERLTRYMCGLKTVWEAVPFPRVPGIISI